MSGTPARTAVVIEDDPDVRDLIDAVLTRAGFTTVLTDSGEAGVEAVRRHDPLLTTVDVQMPGMDGFATTRAIRRHSNTYLIMVTALADEENVLAGFRAGADDYLTKPFRGRELMARAMSMLQRPRHRTDVTPEPERLDEAESSTLEWGALSLDLAARMCVVDGAEVELTRTEFDLIASLAGTGRRARSKADLVLVARRDTSVTNHVSDADKRSVEVHIANLRRKLGEDALSPRFVETVRGVGYRMAALA